MLESFICRKLVVYVVMSWVVLSVLFLLICVVVVWINGVVECFRVLCGVVFVNMIWKFFGWLWVKLW